MSLSSNSFYCYSGELKRKDDLLASMDKKQDEAREKMQEVNMHFLDTYSSDEILRNLYQLFTLYLGPNADAETPGCPQLKRNDE